jgi:hypothetical protein
MKLSKQTLASLKNFSSISANLLITEGSVLKTRSIQNTIFATVTTPDTFPSEFGIYDLNEFLAVLSLFNDPELEFSADSNYVKIYEGANSIKYFAADKSVLSYPTKDITFPNPEISFKVSADTLALINKTASVLRVPDISFIGTDGKLSLSVSDKKNPTSNAFDVAIGETPFTFKVNLKVEMLKFVQTDYVAEVSSKKIAKFTASDSDLNYFIGIESDSTFE